MNQPNSTRVSSGYVALDRLMSPVMLVFVALSAAMMVGIMALAIFSIFQSIAEYLLATAAYYAGPPSDGAGAAVMPKKILLLVALIKGIELIFIAPLPFLLLLGLTRYSQAVLKGQETAEARDLLETVKLIIAALFISIASAHVIIEFVSSAEREPVAFAPMLVLIGILAIYVGILNRGHAGSN